MKRLSLPVAAVFLIATLSACAQQRTAVPVPAGSVDRPAAPLDVDLVVEPLMASEDRSADDRAALPPGHPEIPSRQTSDGNDAAKDLGLPEGHPDIFGKNGLPDGHPDISQMMMKQQNGAAAAEEATQPAPQEAPKSAGTEEECTSCPDHAPAGADPAAAMPLGDVAGTLNVRVVQGTAGSEAIRGGSIKVELRQRDQIIRTIEAELDEAGTAVIDTLPVHLVFQPVVKMLYDDVEYHVVGQPMGASNPVQDLELAVYNTTDQPPDWQVQMRHVMVQPVEDNMLQVTEIIALWNPSDRTWVGHDGATTFSLPLPPEAQEAQVFSGFHACCMKLEDGQVVNTVMLPGQSQYHLAYLLPINGGSSEVSISAPVPSMQVAVLLPNDGSVATPYGLESMGTVDMGKGTTRYFKAGGVPAGSELKLTISGLSQAAPGGATPGNSAQAAKIVAAVGGLMILLFGAAFLFSRSGKAARR